VVANPDIDPFWGNFRVGGDILRTREFSPAAAATHIRNEAGVRMAADSIEGLFIAA
jgi:hypothetical protein